MTAHDAPTPAQTPYSGLTPDVVLDALQAVSLRGDGRLLTLNSYENRVFQVHLEDKTCVVAKFYRAGRWSDAQILEEHQFAYELEQAEIPVVPPMVLTRDGPRCSVLGTPPSLGLMNAWRYAVAPSVGGRAPEVSDPAVLTWLGRFLGRLHAVGAAHAFVQRHTLSVAHTGRRAFNYLREHRCISEDQQRAWLEAAAQALDLADMAFSKLADSPLIRVHGDCHLGNILWTEHGPHVVDLDDACMAPAVQDLWMLLSGNEDEIRAQKRALLSGYDDFAEFDERQWRLVEPLRTLRMIHYSAWLAQRWSDPAFPAAFPWFGNSAYWSEQTQLLAYQAQLMRQTSTL